MTTEIYADTIAAVNFSMDFLSLYICARLMRYRIFPWRLAAAAGIGALYALVSVILSAYIDLTYTEFPLLIIFAFIMAYTAFGGGIKKVLGCGCAYFAVNLGLGGLMTVLFSSASKILNVSEADTVIGSPDSTPALFFLITAVSAAVSLAYGKIKERIISERNVHVRLKAFGTEQQLNMMTDSGNLLKDPFSGKPVIIISANSVRNNFPQEINDAIQKKTPTIVNHTPNGLRLIPTHSINGNGILLGFRPELVEIDGTVSDAIVAIDPANENFNGFDGLVPTSLVQL